MREKITVLVADDNNDFAMTLTNYLENDEEMEVIAIAKDGNGTEKVKEILKGEISAFSGNSGVR